MKEKTLFQLLKDFSNPERVIESLEIDQIKEKINQCFLPNSKISDTGLKEFQTVDEQSHQTLKSFLMRILKADNENIKQAIQATIIYIDGNSKKTNQQLVDNLEIHKLAERYTDNFEIPLHILLHLNHSSMIDEDEQTTSVQHDLSVRTFGHALIATKSLSKISFFLRDMLVYMGSELDFVRAYLTELYDSDQKSFIDRMKANEILEKLPEHFRNHKSIRYILKLDDNTVLSIDTHQSSINQSVDASISRLLSNFLQSHSFPMAIITEDSTMTVAFERTEAFNQQISNYIDSFYHLLLSYYESDSLIKELVHCDDTTGKDLKSQSEYLKFQINAVIRLVNDLKNGKLGPNPHYTIDPRTYNRCGINIIEILAISYHATLNITNWKGHNSNHIIKYFISQLYRARRGYNIDVDNENENNYVNSEDKNKCPDGTIHEIISGLLGHKDVEISIKTIETFKFSFYKRLPEILRIIYQEDPLVIQNWYLTMTSNNSLTDKIINNLLTDKEVTDEYSANQISNFTVKSIRSMSDKSIIDLLHKLDQNLIHQCVKNLKILRYHHHFGYIPYLEYLYRNKVDRDKLVDCVYNEINLSFFDQDADPTNNFHYYQFLMHSPRSDFREAFASIFKEAISKFIIFSPSSASLNIDEIRHIYRKAIEVKDYIIGDLIVDLILQKKISDSVIYSIMKYAIQFQHNNAIHSLVEKQKNNFPKDILFIALEYNNEYVFANFQNPTTLNYIDMGNHTLLHQAATHDRSNFLSQLIDIHGLDPNAQNSTQQTPLHLAIKFKAIQSFLTLLKNDKTLLNIPDNLGYRAFDYAITKPEFHEHINALITHQDFNFNTSNNHMLTPLHLVITHGKIQHLELLIKNPNILPNIQDIEGNTPLHLSIIHKKFPFFMLLLSCDKIDHNIKNQDGDAPLHLAIRSNNTSFLLHLIKQKKIDVNTTNKSGNTLLHECILKDSLEMFLELLADNEIDPNIKNQDGDAPLHFAIRSNNTSFLSHLIKHKKIDVNTTNNSGNALLHECILMDYLIDFLELLMCNNIDPNIQDKNGNTPLHLIVRLNRKDFFHAIMEHQRLNFNIQNKTGNTLLHLIIQLNHKDFFDAIMEHQLLADNEIDPNIKNQDGDAPLHFAIRSNNTSFLPDLIKHKKIDLNTTNKLGNALLHECILMDYLIDFLELLKCNNIDPNIQDKNGNTPLHLIVQLNRIDFFRAIMEHQRLNINIQNKTGNTSLHQSILYPNENYFITILSRNDTILHIQNIFKKTILHLAVDNNLPKFIKKIIKKFKQEHFTLTDKYGNTALQRAIYKESLDIVKLILPYSKNTLANLNDDKKSAIFMALECELTDIFSYLCQNSDYKKLIVTNHKKQYLTHAAIQLSNIDMLTSTIKFMSEKLQDTKEYAAWSLEQRIILVLEQKNQEGFNSIAFSIVKGDFTIFQWLFENYNLDLNQEDHLKRNLLHISAIYQNNIHFTRQLLSINPNYLYKKDSNGFTPLCYSIIHRQFKVFRELYELYLNNDKNGLIELNIVHHLIKSVFAFSLIREVIDSCPECINKLDSEGNTPLLLAAEKYNFLVLDLLIQIGADVKVTNNEGKNIFHYIANTEMTPTIIKAMRENPDLITAKDNDNKCYLTLLVQHQNIMHILRYLSTFLTIDYGLFNEMISLVDSRLIEYKSSKKSEIRKMLSIMLFNNKDILTNAQTSPEWMVVFDIINKFGILPEVSQQSQYYPKIQTIKSYEKNIFATLLSLIISEDITEYLNNPDKIDSIPTEYVCKIFSIDAQENPAFSEKFSSDFKRLATIVVRDIKRSGVETLSEQSIGPNTSLVIASRILASNYATLNQEI